MHARRWLTHMYASAVDDELKIPLPARREPLNPLGPMTAKFHPSSQVPGLSAAALSKQDGDLVDRDDHHRIQYNV